MSEWQPQVIRLDNIERHPGADTLEMATVLGGYTVIFKEGQYKNGDLISYIPVDSVCSDMPEFDWLGDKKRIKAVRLRGVFSMGITAPAPPGMSEGDSIVDFYGLKKHEYEEEVPEQRNTENEHGPSGWTITNYDLDALRKYGHKLIEGEDVIIHEKIEGCVEYDTIVDTLEYGEMKVGKLVEDKPTVHVKCMDTDSGDIEYKQVLEFHNNGASDDWYEIETDVGHTLRITGNHLVWMPKLGCYRKVSDLSDNDVVSYE